MGSACSTQSNELPRSALCKRCAAGSPQDSLHVAILDGHDHCVLHFLTSGISPNGEQYGTNPPLVTAATHGLLKICRHLLNAGADPDLAAGNGFVALHAAAWHDHLDICKLLLDAGANVNQRDHAGWTALDWARCYSRDCTAEGLLELGAEPGATDFEPGTVRRVLEAETLPVLVKYAPDSDEATVV